MPTRDRRLPATPLWFKLWAVFCALLSVSLLGLVAWAVITLVNHFTGS